MTFPTPSPKFKAFSNTGIPLVAGKLYTYAAGTNTNQATYVDVTLGTPNTNPVILDSRGEADVWLGALKYKLVLKDATDVLIWSVDNIGGPDALTIATVLATLAASGGSDLVGFLQAGTGATLRTVQNKCRDIVSVKDYGAVGDGIVDDTAAIQAAIDHVGGTIGGTVYFPAGTYKTTTTLSIVNDYVFLEGEGRLASTIQPSAMAVDHILFDGVSKGGIFDLAILPSGVQTGATAAIRMKGCHNVVLDNFLISGNAQNGVWISGGGEYLYNTVSNFEISACTENGIYLGQPDITYSVWLTNGVIDGCLNGISMVDCTNVCATDVIAINCTANGITTFPAALQQVTSSFFTNVQATKCGNGFVFTADGGNVYDINFTGCWSASNTGVGFGFASSDGITMNCCRVINNGSHGIVLVSGNNFSLDGNQIGMNSTDASGAYQGILVAENVGYFTITDNRIGGPFGIIGATDPNWQQYGILIAGGTTDNFTVIGNDLTGNVTGGIANGATGTNVVVTGNLGAATKTSGYNLIATGGTSVTVTHGLIGTPLPQDILIAPTTSYGANPLYVDSTSITATTFDVKAAAVTAGDFNFNWQARIWGA